MNPDMLHKDFSKSVVTLQRAIAKLMMQTSDRKQDASVQVAASHDISLIPQQAKAAVNVVVHDAEPTDCNSAVLNSRLVISVAAFYIHTPSVGSALMIASDHFISLFHQEAKAAIIVFNLDAEPTVCKSAVLFLGYYDKLIVIGDPLWMCCAMPTLLSPYTVSDLVFTTDLRKPPRLTQSLSLEYRPILCVFQHEAPFFCKPQRLVQ